MPPKPTAAPSLKEVMTWLDEARTAHDFDNLKRFGITATNALGVSMANLQRIAKRAGRSHDLAAELWATGCYEARMLTAFIEDPAQVTPAQMDRWCRDFDNWGICDTLCFKLFDQTPYAWAKVTLWSRKKNEFEKRAAFALLASLAGHDKRATDEQFLATLTLIERASTDERNFVKKGVSWALRSMARRSTRVREAATELAERLAQSPDPTTRWIGKDGLRDLKKAKR